MNSLEVTSVLKDSQHNFFLRISELAFNLLVLVGAIKGCDRIVKEIMGL